MNDAYLEFLTENAQRNFPFVEDATLTSTADYRLPNDAILDLRGFHRERPDLTPCLHTICGGDSGTMGAVVGSYAIYFRMGRNDDPLVFQVLIAEDNSNWPVVATATLMDPIYPQSRIGTVRVTIGSGILTFPTDEAHNFEEEAILEQSLVAQLYRNQIDSLKLIHLDDDSEYVGGDVVLRGGFNFDLQQIDQTIRLVPSLGGGELGRWLGSINGVDTSKCRGSLLTLNAQQPTDRGEFFMKGANGIEVENLPAEHKIRLTVSKQTLGVVECE